MIEVKEHDVFLFRYSDEYRESHNKVDLNWCFDGKLIAHDYDGKIMLVDTYWGVASESRRFTVEEALEKGELHFLCNLDDVETIKEYEICYYGRENVINLSSQHGCRERYVVKKNAKRSKDSMVNHIKEKIQEYQSKIDWATWQIKLLNEKLDDIRDGKDINKIYI